MRHLPLLAALLVLPLPLPLAAETTLRILSYNIWGGGANEGKPIDETVAVLRAAGADLIGLQEVRTEGEVCEADVCPPGGDSVGPALAEALGYFYHEQATANDALWANGILSRWPILQVAPHDLGVQVDIDGRAVWLFNIHLDDSPYQPYQLLGIEYGNAPFITNEAEAIRFATETRGPAMALLAESMAVAEAEGAAAVFVTGDFNEPSGLDWTPAAVAAGLHPVAVDWPTTAGLMAQGFTDTYRAIHPDPVAKPAFTWTPMYPEEATDDHPDRIDFVFARGAGLTVLDAWIVGEDGPRSDLVVTPWPADHRAVLAEVRF
jgi:endonuclease/exonuclease/phosphatase family metal-dependent hydrolase